MLIFYGQVDFLKLEINRKKIAGRQKVLHEWPCTDIILVKETKGNI
jgi:hypothetical protein